MTAREQLIEDAMDGVFLRWASVAPELSEIEPEIDLILLRALDAAGADGMTSEQGGELIAEFQLTITNVALWALVLQDRAKVRVEADRGVVFWQTPPE